jgi:RDD family
VEESPGQRSLLRRTVDGTIGAAIGRVEGRVTDTAQAMIDDLEPYLSSETVPRIIDALEPYLATETVPRILDQLVPRLVAETVPEIVEGLLPYLVEQVAPKVVDGMTDHLSGTTVPVLLEELTPRLADELLPVLLERLRPYLERELVPGVVDALTPHIIETTAPRVVEGLMPRINAEVVPAVLDGMVDDPRIRDLVREQSFGLVLDAVERLRRFLSSVDDTAERLARRLLPRRRVVEEPLPESELLPGRTRSHAGMASRTVGSIVDLTLVAFLAGQALSAVLAVLGALFGSVPPEVVVVLTFVAGLAGPVYLGLCWWLAGRTVGGLLGGYAVVGRDGQPLGLMRAAVRAGVSLPLAAVWALGMLPSRNDPLRRGLLDRLVGSRTPYMRHRARTVRATGVDDDVPPSGVVVTPLPRQQAGVVQPTIAVRSPTDPATAPD